MIRFRLPAASLVSLRVYDVGGQLVRTLVEGGLQPGEHSAFWDGRSDGGQASSSGVYLVSLRAGDHHLTQKIQLLK
jgi:flagellar hook assembly protein FlgD